MLDGPSFGLAFFLLLASRDARSPAARRCDGDCGDRRARAAVAGGRGAAKIAGLVALAPSIRRVIVCVDQVRRRERRGGRPVSKSSGSRARADALVRLRDTGCPIASSTRASTPSGAPSCVDAFFRLALAGRGAALDWSPIERGAAIALREWPLVDDQEYRLQFASAVAARHERNAGELPLPDEMASPRRVARAPAGADSPRDAHASRATERRRRDAALAEDGSAGGARAAGALRGRAAAAPAT